MEKELAIAGNEVKLFGVKFVLNKLRKWDERRKEKVTCFLPDFVNEWAKKKKKVILAAASSKQKPSSNRGI